MQVSTESSSDRVSSIDYCVVCQQLTRSLPLSVLTCTTRCLSRIDVRDCGLVLLLLVTERVNWI
jgi:hypothetical protein